MEVAAELNCPWCGQVNSVSVDTSQPEQQWITDCEVCCRPFQVTATCEPGEILGLDASPA